MKKIVSVLVIVVASLGILVSSLYAASPDVEVGDVNYYFCTDCPLSHCLVYLSDLEPVQNDLVAAATNGGCLDVGQVSYCPCYDSPEYCAEMTRCDVFVPGSGMPEPE